MSHIPTIRVKSTNPEHHGGFILRNPGSLQYGEELFMAAEFELLGEHAVRLKMASLSSEDFFVIDAKEWLELKAQERTVSAETNRSAREEETLRIARSANRIAISAIILSVITTSIVAVIQFIGGKTS